MPVNNYGKRGRKSQKGLLFGPAGIPLSSRASSTEAGIERVAELGLGCMEIQFVRGVKMSPTLAHNVNTIATQKRIKLSVHAPYFINLNAHDPEKLNASKARILQAAHIGGACGAESIVFHAAYYLGDAPEEVLAVVKTHILDLSEQLARGDNRVLLRPEVTGKHSQFGTLEEVLDLSAEVEGIAPCIDFAHLHAYAGINNSYSEFAAILDKLERKLGRQALDNIHIHMSGIAYGRSGETKHLPLEESDFQYKDLLQALKDHQVQGTVICESPALEQDALLLQRTYQTC